MTSPNKLKVEINNCVKKTVFSDLEIVSLAQKISGFEKKIKGDVEINIVGEKEIKSLNKKYRNKNKVTDVLSFAWQEDKKIKSNFLGQIYICLPQIKRQAKEYNVTIKEEFKRMLIHGLLHLVGYDHQIDKDEKKMFALQDKILSCHCEK